MPLGAEGLDLVVDGEHRQLRQHEVHRFAGESVVRARDAPPGSQDLNLMVRREFGSGELDVVQIDSALTMVPPPGSTAVLVVLDGSLVMAPQHAPLTRLDAIIVGSGGELHLSGRGRCAVALARQAP